MQNALLVRVPEANQDLADEANPARGGQVGREDLFGQPAPAEDVVV